MKKLIALMIVMGSFLTGCVAYEVPVTTSSYGYTTGYYGDGYRNRDRDGDGVPNRRDARPNNPYRY